MFPQLGPSVGFIAANGFFLVLGATMDEADFLAWGWRVPFVASLALVIIGLYIRTNIAETPIFLRRQRKASTASTYCLAYGTTTLRIPRTTMLALTMVGVLFMGAGTGGSALVSDRIGRRRTLICGTALAIGWGLIMFPLMESGFVGLALAGALGIMGLIFGPMGAYLPELFPTEYPYTGASVAYSLGGVLGGAVPPLVMTILQSSAGIYVSAVAVLSLLCLLALPETGKHAL